MNKVADHKFVITTALSESMDISKNNILLGEWCREFSQDEKVTNDIEILSYGLEDQEKKDEECRLIFNLYDVLLAKISEQLQEVGHIHFSPRSWEILLGPWLMIMVSTIFDKWSSWGSLDPNKQYHTIKLNYKLQEFVHFDWSSIMGDVFTDSWNHTLYCEVAKEYNNIHFINTCTKLTPEKGVVSGNTKKLLSDYVKFLWNKIFLHSKQSILLSGNPVGLKNIFNLIRRNPFKFQITNHPNIIKSSYNKKLRDKCYSNIRNNNEFKNSLELICTKIIFKYLPTCY